MNRYKVVSLILAAILLVITTAGASIYFAKEPSEPPEKIVEKTIIVQPSPRVVQTQSPAPVPNCNDGNIAGKAVGGVGGGVLGSLAGKGNGKTAATIGGTLGGAYLGGKAIPLNNVTCK